MEDLGIEVCVPKETMYNRSDDRAERDFVCRDRIERT